MISGLESGLLLDQLWHRLSSGVEQSKKSDLLLLARVLSEAGAVYAVTGDLALQAHEAEPRTAIAVDVAGGRARRSAAAEIDSTPADLTLQNADSRG